MNNFQIITAIIYSLTEIEIKQVKKSLKYNESKNNKLIDVFELIFKRKITDQNKLVKLIYGDLSSSNLDSFRKLCQRLFDKLIDSISIEANFHLEKELYSDIFKKRLKVKRNLMIYQILLVKGMPYQWMKRYLKELIELSELYEFFEDEISFRRSLYHIYMNENSLEMASKCLSEIQRKSLYLQYVVKSEWYDFLYIHRVQYKSIDDKTMISDIKEAIKEVEEYYDNSKLNFLNYQKLMLKLQLSHYEEDYERAEKIIYELIEITESNVSIKLRSKVAQNYMNLAYTQFFLHKFEEAYDNSLLAAHAFVYHENELNIYREAGVFALIYLKRYAEAEERLKTIIDSGSLGNSPEQLSKRHLMMGFIKYLEGDFKRAFMHLQETKEVESDREGWNMGIRILNIYLTLSTEKVDLADQRINAMRKHIERTARMRNLRKRDLIIFRILSHLSRSGFDFREVWEERQKDFQLLRSDLSDYRWVPRSHELIIFDQWFEAKVLGKPYDPHFPGPKANTKRLENISQGG